MTYSFKPVNCKHCGTSYDVNTWQVCPNCERDSITFSAEFVQSLQDKISAQREEIVQLKGDTAYFRRCHDQLKSENSILRDEVNKLKLKLASFNSKARSVAATSLDLLSSTLIK